LQQALLRAAVRIRYERYEGGATITGHGTAFGADLSRYGYPGRRYLLTAAHNVLDDSQHPKRPFATLKIEIDDGVRSCWTRCKALAFDEELDLCLVESADELQHALPLADSEPPTGSPLVLAGSPRGIPVALFQGTLTRKFERGTVRSSAQIPFDHGDSGGPVVCPRAGAVIGVAVAGVPKDGDLDREIGLFVPIVGVTSFLEAHRKGPPALPPVIVAATLPLAVPVAPPPASKPAPAVAVLPAVEPVRQPEPLAVVVPLASRAPVDAPSAPVSNASSEALAAPPAAVVVADSAAAAARVHVVTWGDNLTRIARQYDVSLTALIAANRLSDPNRLLVGQKLAIPR
jgi:LysM repeat protein